MTDRIERFGESVIQHGKHSDRAYLMKLARRDLPGIVERLDDLAREHAYTKIFAKVGAGALDLFRGAGYRLEATVPGMYGGREDGHFLGKPLDPARAVEPEPDRVREVLAACKGPRRPLPDLHRGSEIVVLDARHAERLAALYGRVFVSYPFPIDDPDCIRRAMDEDVVFYGVLDDAGILAASSAEMDREGANAEMTDFATRPEARGRGAAGHLLARMGADMRTLGVRTLYTIARATSFGMNVTFARAGFVWAGTLVANTQIMGRIESMNVWYRRA